LKTDVNIEHLYSNTELKLFDNSTQNTVLFCASDVGNIEIVKLLISKGINPNIMNSLNRTALLYACYNARLDIAKILIEAGAKVSFEGLNLYGSLQIAIRSGNLELVKFLVDYGGDIKEEFSLLSAISTTSYELIRYLLDKGAPIQSDKYSHNYLLSAVFDWADYEPKIRLLVEYGAVIDDITFVEAILLRGTRALNLCIELGCQIDYSNIIEKVIDMGFEREGGEEAEIVRENYKPIFEILLRKGAVVNNLNYGEEYSHIIEALNQALSDLHSN
jgi:ankyrin repeat protein